MFYRFSLIRCLDVVRYVLLLFTDNIALDVPEKKLARKKFTSGHARARKMAVQAGKRLRSLKEGLTHSDSEESYGEVDEKTVEEGWEVEDPQPKTEVGPSEGFVFRYECFSKVKASRLCCRISAVVS